MTMARRVGIDGCVGLAAVLGLHRSKIAAVLILLLS